MLFQNLRYLFGDTLDLVREAYSLLFEWHLEHADSIRVRNEETFKYMDLVTSLPLPTEAKLEDMVCFFLHQVMGLAKWTYFEKLEVPGRDGAVNLGDVARIALRFIASNGLDPFLVAKKSALCNRFPLGLNVVEI